MQKTLKHLSFSLLALFTIIFLGAQPAHAIGNGGTEAGSVTGTGTENYFFYAAAGQYIEVGMTEITQDSRWYGGFNIYYPDGTSFVGAGCGTLSPGCRTGGGGNSVNQTGMYKITAKNVLGSSGFTGSFLIHLAVTGLPSFSTSVYGGQTSNGSIYGASIDLYTINAKSGDNVTITMTPGSGFTQNANIAFFYPDGSSWAGGAGNPVTRSFSIVTTGAYLLRAQSSITFTGPGAYTLAVSGNTGLPTAAKQDGGARCIPCEKTAKAAADGAEPPAQSIQVPSTGEVMTP